MTDQEIYRLLINDEHGYRLTEEEYQQLSFASSITWRNIVELPRNMGLLKSVTNLDLSWNSNLSDISVLSGLTGLKNLELRGTSVSNICALTGLTGLTNLDLSYNDYLRDISALSGLTGLTNLDMGGTGVSDISVLSGLTGLIELDLGLTSVRDISVLSSLTSLTNLDLSECRSLTDISALSGLKGLTKLGLSDTGVSNISALSGLTELTNIDLSQCHNLMDISTLSGLKNLTNLDLSDTDMSNIGPLSELIALTTLDLSGCYRLIDISALSRLTSLINLDLSGCYRLADLSALSGLTSLTNLDLSDCKILTDLSALSGLTSLTTLDLSDCHLLPGISALSGLTLLTDLDLSGCMCLSDISALTGLASLTNLALSHCRRLTDISAISNLTCLTNLELSNCKGLTDISSLSNLKALTNLDLSECSSLIDISALSGLTRLTNLDLSYSDVSDISALSGLTSLKILDLRGLSLSMIPEAIIGLGLEFISDESPKGPGIYIDNLKLTDQPIEIFSQSREVIVEYFKSLKEESPINECKVVFLGDGGAGKTLMIERLMREGDKISDFNGESTPGICISSKKYMIRNEEIELHFWDFGGQAIMHSMHRLFLTNRTLYVIVTNARDNKANEQAWYWIRNIKSFANGAPVLLVINHRDQNPNANVNENGLLTEYPNLKGVQIISALNDEKKDFLLDVRDEICRIVSDMETVHTPFSKPWLSLMNDLQEMPKDYITSDEFYLKCQDNGVGTKEELLDQIIRWYQDLGVCFYSGKHPLSKQYMVLKPRWLLNALYILAFNGRGYAKNGIITESDIHELICKKVSDENIKKVWPEIQYKPHEIQYIINVLLNFNLIYRLDHERFFIPMLCDENEPKKITSFDSEDAVHISFDYKYLPENVLHRLMVRHGYELNTNVVWRTGAIFERRQLGWMSLVRIRDNRLDVFATTENQKEHPINSYLDMMRESVYEINKEFGFQADEYISYRRDGKEERFKYKKLIGSRKTGIPQVYSEVFEQPIDIEEILGILNKSKDEQTEAIVEQMLSVLNSMTGRSVDLNSLDEPALTRTFQSEVEPVLNARFGIQIAREYTLGRAKKTIGETDLYFFSQKDGIKQEWYIFENKVIENFSKQYEQLMGYINPNFRAGITLSINKNKEWEVAFDYICEKLNSLKEERGKFAPILIDRKTGTNGTRYVKSEHIVPETGHMMPVYHLVLQLSDDARQEIALSARR